MNRLFSLFVLQSERMKSGEQKKILPDAVDFEWDQRKATSGSRYGVKVY